MQKGNNFKALALSAMFASLSATSVFADNGRTLGQAIELSKASKDAETRMSMGVYTPPTGISTEGQPTLPPPEPVAPEIWSASAVNGNYVAEIYVDGKLVKEHLTIGKRVGSWKIAAVSEQGVSFRNTKGSGKKQVFSAFPGRGNLGNIMAGSTVGDLASTGLDAALRAGAAANLPVGNPLPPGLAGSPSRFR